MSRVRTLRLTKFAENDVNWDACVALSNVVLSPGNLNGRTEAMV